MMGDDMIIINRLDELSELDKEANDKLTLNSPKKPKSILKKRSSIDNPHDMSFMDDDSTSNNSKTNLNPNDAFTSVDDSDISESNVDYYDTTKYTSYNPNQIPQQPQQLQQLQQPQQPQHNQTLSPYNPSYHHHNDDTQENRIRVAENEEKRIAELLDCKLPREVTQTRQGPANMKLHYIESHVSITIANKIFGPTNWSCEVIEIRHLGQEQINNVNYAFCTAKVKVSVITKSLSYGDKVNTHEDIGDGTGKSSTSKFEAMQKAEKEAISDARKRALRLFGDALGNCLYDKEFLKLLKNKTKSQPETPLSKMLLGDKNDRKSTSLISKALGSKPSTPISKPKQLTFGKNQIKPIPGLKKR